MKHKTNIAIACLMALYGLSAQAQDTPIGAPQDWSSRHVVHHKPMTPGEFEAAGRGAELRSHYRDPRYVAAVLRRIEAETPRLQRAYAAAPAAARNQASNAQDHRRRMPRTEGDTGPRTVLRDWSNVLGGGTDGQGGNGMEGVFPAKYTFDITADPSCDNDFVVYPTNAPGATQSGTRQEQWSGSIGGNPGAGNTVTIGLPGPRQVVLTASNTDNTGRNFLTSGTNNTRADNLRNAINRWSGQTGFRATGTGSTVTVISNTAGNINGNAVSEGLTNFGFTNSYPGSGTTNPGQPTIIAFNQVYDGFCPAGATGRDAADAPNVMWAYNTGTGYVPETSPVLSYNDEGQQVAFLQRNGNTLQLVLLKPARLTTAAARQAAAGNPTALTSLTAAQYQAARSGSAAAMHVITLNSTSNAGSTPTYSSPFVDYAGDVLWVGDGNGRLHKFTGVFDGLPAEVVGSGFPSTVAAGMKLSSPVYDNGNVYIGSQSGAGDLGGKLHRISALNGNARFDSAKLSIANAIGLRESPIVTGTPAPTGSVFAFLFNDGSAGNDTDCAPTDNNRNSCRVVARFPLDFAANAQPAERAYVGRGNNINSTLYAGAFDDAYYNSANGTGYMYILGGEQVDTYIPRLWRIPLTNGTLGQSQIGPVLAPKTCATFPGCGALDGNGNPPTPNVAKWNWSPVTMARLGADEYVYFSMPSHGRQTACAGACVYLFNLNDLRNGTSEAWRLSISNNGGNGIPTNENNGTITVNGTVLTANVHFSTAGDRKADQLAVIAAINNLTPYSAGEEGECETGGGNCYIWITSDSTTNLAGNVVATSRLGQTSLSNERQGTPGSVVGWGATVNANTGLKAHGGTGGIVVDNNSSATSGAAQIYYSQQGTGGNAIQASQSGLE